MKIGYTEKGETVVYEVVEDAKIDARTRFWNWVRSIRCAWCHWPDERIQAVGEICEACKRLTRSRARR